jgi:hypothetical protein
MAEEVVVRKKSGWKKLFAEPKQMISLLAALAALATATTSLVKALDKSIEHASYDSLSKSIKELQDDNSKIHDKVDIVEMDADVILVTPPVTFTDAGASPVSTYLASAPHDAGITVMEPLASVHVAHHRKTDAGARLAAPPSWNGVREMAATSY